MRVIPIRENREQVFNFNKGDIRHGQMEVEVTRSGGSIKGL